MQFISSRQNPYIKHLVRLQKEASYRKECQSLFIESKKLCLEVAQILPVKQYILQEGISPFDPNLTTTVTPSVFEKISCLQNSEGFCAEVQRPPEASLEGCQKILLLDELQNPGNLGTLIRSAVGFGFDAIALLGSSVDPYHPKVIRASMGACLQLPIKHVTLKEVQCWAQDNQGHLYTADASGQDISKLQVQRPFMLILGNESKGPQITKQLNTHLVSLPIEKIESLNVSVAGSLLMYLMRTPK